MDWQGRWVQLYIAGEIEGGERYLDHVFGRLAAAFYLMRTALA